MPYSRPTLATLANRLIADVESRLSGAVLLVRRSVLRVLTRAVAGAFHELYGFVAWVARAAFPDQADSAELRRWASIWGIIPLDATFASGTVTVTGSDGSPVDAGTVWRSIDGAEYASTANAVIAAGTATVAVTALAAGAGGNAESGAPLSLVSPLPGVVSDAVVDTAIAGGAPAEDVEALRARLLERIRRPPRGGSMSDYLQWAKGAHPDVTRRWVVPRASGLGTVTVYIMTDEASTNGIPAAATVDTVQDYIDARRPVTADVTVAVPVPVELDFTISALIPDSSTVRAAVEAELADLIVREAAPGGTIYLTHIAEAISGALGEIDHDLQVPSADVVSSQGEISVMGSVSWA